MKTDLMIFMSRRCARPSRPARPSPGGRPRHGGPGTMLSNETADPLESRACGLSARIHGVLIAAEVQEHAAKFGARGDRGGQPRWHSQLLGRLAGVYSQVGGPDLGAAGSCSNSAGPCKRGVSGIGRRRGFCISRRRRPTRPGGGAAAPVWFAHILGPIRRHTRFRCAAAYRGGCQAQPSRAVLRCLG